MKFNPINKLRLLTNLRQEPFLSLRNILGYSPKNLEIYNLALRHRSMPLRNEKGDLMNNERLEFLGDAVLNSIVSDVLYHKYKNEKEGFLTNARSNIVKRETLNKICQQIGLDNLLIVDKHNNFSKNTHVYGNALEAFIGAVYLDQGYEKCAQFIKKRILISSELMTTLVEDKDNFKSELLEWCQRRHYSLNFVLIDETIDEKNRHTFVTQVLIQNALICTGRGTSKKESHQQASAKALKIIANEANFISRLNNQ